MTIKIIGSNTINGIKLKRMILKIANTIDGKITINLIDDLSHNDLPYAPYELSQNAWPSMLPLP